MRGLIATTFIVTLCAVGLDAQVLATRTRDAITVTVAEDGSECRIRLMRNGQTLHRNPDICPTEVADIGISTAGTVSVVSDVMGGWIVSILGVDGAFLEFPTLHPALSPDGRFVIFERHYPRNSDEPTVYVLVDVENPGADPGNSSSFHPTDQNEHALQSSLQWVDARTFAFLDLDLTAGDSWLVVGQVTEEGDISRLVTRQLDPALLVDSTKIDIDRVPAAAAVYDPRITRLDGPGLFLRLLFPTHPAMKVRRLDIHVW